MTASKTLLNEKFCEILFDETNQIVIAKWKGFLSLEQITTGCKVITSTIKTHKLKNHLSDQTMLKVLSKEAQDYLTGTWFGDVDKAGLQKIAILMADDIFAQASVNKVNMQSSYNKMQINSFNSLEQCNNWFKQ